MVSPWCPTARGLTRRIKRKSFFFVPRSGGFSRKRGRRWHRMSPTASTQLSIGPKRGRGTRGHGQPQPQLLRPAPGTPCGSGLRCRLPADAARGVPAVGGRSPGRKCQLSPRSRVRTGAKEGTGEGGVKKIPCERRPHRMCVREPRVGPAVGEVRPCPLRAGGQQGKGVQWGTESVPPALPVSPRPLTGQE